MSGFSKNAKMDGDGLLYKLSPPDRYIKQYCPYGTGEPRQCGIWCPCFHEDMDKEKGGHYFVYLRCDLNTDFYVDPEEWRG